LLLTTSAPPESINVKVTEALVFNRLTKAIP
jgi:hypothetical protein